MKTLTAIYSPLCEASAAFLGKLEEWFAREAVEVVPVAFHEMTEAHRALYRKNGLLPQGKRIESCFIDVFYEERCIDSVPLHKERIFAALGLPIPADCVETPVYHPGMPEYAQALAALRADAICWAPITRETLDEALSMCLCQYPHGNPPVRFHTRCAAMKRAVFEEVWAREHCAGVYAKLQGVVIGFLEVLPREIVKQYGFLTGGTGQDEAYLTIGCYEVAYNMPRVEVIDALMRQLLTMAGQFQRDMLEGVGVYEWPDGFTPYWVYDKYGFHKAERLAENKVVMEKNIQGLR